jgi:hypothetical protein
MLLEVISLETFPFVKRHYTEVVHVGSLTPLLVYCTHTALPTGILLLWMLALHNSHEGMFPHVTQKLPRGSTWGLGGVAVDGPGRTKSVSDSGSAAAIWSVDQAFATCIRNSLYRNFVPGFRVLWTKNELKSAQFVSHNATFFVHFTVFLRRE